MAGSRRWFEYVTDTNQKYSVSLDETNSEATLNESALVGNRTAAHPVLPKGLKMRYLLAESIGVRKLQRKFFVGDPSLLIGLTSPVIIECAPYPDSLPELWEVTAYRGERSTFTPDISTVEGDTGLNDGDQGRDEAPD